MASNNAPIVLCVHAGFRHILTHKFANFIIVTFNSSYFSGGECWKPWLWESSLCALSAYILLHDSGIISQVDRVREPSDRELQRSVGCLSVARAVHVFGRDVVTVEGNADFALNVERYLQLTRAIVSNENSYPDDNQ